jgi:hypothetical protein
MKIGVHLFRDTNDIIAKLPILFIIHDECHRGEGCQDGNIAGRLEQGLALTSFDGVFVLSSYFCCLYLCLGVSPEKMELQ